LALGVEPTRGVMKAATLCVTIETLRRLISWGRTMIEIRHKNTGEVLLRA